MSNRANLQFFVNGNLNKEQGVNLGELTEKLEGVKDGHKIFRETTEIVNRVLFKQYGPKTHICITAAVYGDRTYSLTGYLMKPVHGKEGIFTAFADEQTGEPWKVTMTFNFVEVGAKIKKSA